MHETESDLERKEWKIEHDAKFLRYFYKHGAWYSASVLGFSELSLPLDELARLELIEAEDRLRSGKGYKAGRKLFT